MTEEMFDGPVIDLDVLRADGSDCNVPERFRSHIPYFFVSQGPTLTDPGRVFRFDWHEQRMGWLLTKGEAFHPPRVAAKPNSKELPE